MPILTPRVMRKFIFVGSLLLSCVLLSQPFVLAQGDAAYEEMKQQALALYRQNRMTEVLPLAEKLHTQNPKDVVVLELYAFSTLASAQTIKDLEARKQTRKKARELAVKAQALGDDSNLLKVILDVPADGSESDFSKRKDVDAAMREGEAAFAQGDFKKAVAAYELALRLDPQQYEAALFIGDVYFKQQKSVEAGKWFAKAIEINPDRETAYRYWGDAMMMVDNNMKEARDKFIEAFVAEPYSRTARVGLIQWADRNKVQLAHPKINIPTSVAKQPDKDGKSQTSITLDINMLGKKDGTSGWMFYGIARSLWMNEKFLKEYPNEKKYRHSLREEMDALKGVIEAANNELKEMKDKSQLDPSIANLLKLHNAGLLEAFILLAIPDQGIAQDYAEYHQTNRDKLRKYLREVVVNGGQIGK